MRTKIDKCTGIYGIYVNNKLVYIGKTTQNFAKRFYQHKYYVDNPTKATGVKYHMYCELARARSEGASVEMIPIVIVEDLLYDSKLKINNRDIESMELALITFHRPRYNFSGVRCPYKYTH